jgi:streptogramin lyase
MTARALVSAIVVAGLALAAVPASAKGDPEAAERQYRIARRLAAEGSPQAGAALRKVIELDPGGALADDAMLDLADLEGIARWPEELGRISEDGASRALAILDELAETHAGGDRAVEARIRRALLYLEPLALRDPAVARMELLAIATTPGAGSWATRARYGLVWLDRIEGKAERAGNAYQRIVLDANDDPAAVRSAVGQGRLNLRAGLFSIAAAWLQEAVEREAPAETGAVDLRELAVRGVLRDLGEGNGWSPSLAERVPVAVRAPGEIARVPDGGWLVADRKGGGVLLLDSAGGATRQWPLDDVQAITVDRFGRSFVAAGEKIYRLHPSEAVAVAGQGAVAPVSSIAVDQAGGVWMADRRGGRIARLDPAGTAPEVVWEDKQMKLGRLAWDGRRIVAVDFRSGRLVAISPSGADALGDATFSKPIDLATDAGGQIAVLDARAMQVVLVGPGGDVRARLATSAAGVGRPAALALGPDGSVDLFDEATGAIMRIP